MKIRKFQDEGLESIENKVTGTGLEEDTSVLPLNETTVLTMQRSAGQEIDEMLPAKTPVQQSIVKPSFDFMAPVINMMPAQP